MIFFPVNILATPLTLVIGAIDTYLFLAGCRCLLGQMSSARGGVLTAICQLTDGLPDALDRWLAVRRGRPAPRWAKWVFVITGLLLCRQLLLWLLAFSLRIGI